MFGQFFANRATFDSQMLFFCKDKVAKKLLALWATFDLSHFVKFYIKTVSKHGLLLVLSGYSQVMAWFDVDVWTFKLSFLVH